VSSKAFSILLVVIVVVGGLIGGSLFAFGDDDAPATAALPTATPTPTADEQIQGESSGDTTVPDGGTGDGAFGGRQRGGGGGFTPIAGALVSVESTGVTVTTAEGDSIVAIPPETPVRLSRTVADAGSTLTAGVELIAFLTRETDGSFSASNIVIGGFGGGGGGIPSRGVTPDGTEFNAVPGTITAFVAGQLSLETADGPIDVTVSDDVTVQLTIAFSNASGELTIGETLTILGQTAEDGTFTPITIATGDLGGLGRGGFGGGQRGGRQQPTTGEEGIIIP
jgi:hypothetical protein